MKHQLTKIAAIIFLALGFARSSNAQWVSTNGPAITPVTCFSVLEGGNTVLAGVSGDVFLSGDLGGPWTSITRNLINPGVVAMDFSVNNIFIGTNSGGVFISSNGGNWNSITPNSGIVTIFSLAVKGTDLFVGTDGALWRSGDNGTTWKDLTPPVSQGIVVSIASSGQNLFTVCENGVYISSDNGTSWTSASAGLPPHVLMISATTTKIYAGTDNGVYVSANNGTTWTAINQNMTGTSVTSVVTDGSKLFAGTQANGVFFSSDNGTSWKTPNTGLPTMKINALAIAGTLLIAATDANGVWRRPLAEFGGNAGVGPSHNDFNLTLSPNPSTGIITIRNAPQDIQHVRVGNVLGESILEVEKPSASEFPIDLSKFPAGTYIVTFTTRNSVIARKVVRE